MADQINIDPSSSQTLADLAAKAKALQDALTAAKSAQAEYDKLKSQIASALGTVITPNPPAPPGPAPATTTTTTTAGDAGNAIWTIILTVMCIYNWFHIHSIEANIKPQPPVPPIPKPIPPNPGPTPVPKPVTSDLYCFIIYQFTDITEAQQMSSVRGDTSLQSSLKALKCTLRFFDVNDPALSTGNYSKVVSSVGTPCIIIQAADSKTPNLAQKSPADSKSVIDLVQKIRNGA